MLSSATRSRCSRGGAEEVAVGLRALQEEVEVVLPGEADAAVHLERRRASRASRRRRRTPSRPTPRAAALGLRVGGPGGEVGERPRALGLHQHLARSGAIPPGRRRSGGRTACAPWRTRRPSPSCAARARRARPTARWRSGRARPHVALQRLAAVGSTTLAKLARRVDRVDLLDVGGRALVRPARWSPSNSTITAASSASGTSGARPFLTTPTVPRASPEAMPGSQRGFCSSLPACCDQRARRRRSRRTATARARSRAPPSGSRARRCRAPGRRAPRR